MTSTPVCAVCGRPLLARMTPQAPERHRDDLLDSHHLAELLWAESYVQVEKVMDDFARKNPSLFPGRKPKDPPLTAEEWDRVDAVLRSGFDDELYASPHLGQQHPGCFVCSEYDRVYLKALHLREKDKDALDELVEL